MKSSKKPTDDKSASLEGSKIFSPSRPSSHKRVRCSAPNSYLMPGFDLFAIAKKLEEAFKGRGTSIEQEGLYIDVSSASRWQAVARQPDYADARSGHHYKDIAQHISHYFLPRIETVDLFALGPGDGDNETRLVQNLLFYKKSFSLFLLDVSQPLLTIAYNHAKMLGPSMREKIFPVLGNMHDLSKGSYIDLYQPQSPSTKTVITMLGYTFGTIESELQFVRNSLAGFTKGTLLLLDLVLTFAPASNPEQVQASDPRLINAHSPGWDAAYEEFLSNTIRRYCEGVKKIEFVQELDYSSRTVPGSYTVAMRAKVHTHDRRVRTFTMMTFKRYDINMLVKAMEGLGWRGSTGWHYGSNNQMMYLFEKAF